MNLTILRRMITEGDASKKALRFLLQCGGECEYLDFKEHFDLTSDYSKVSFARDAVAMKNTGGGYIVAGVEDKTWKNIGFSSPLILDSKLLTDMIQKTFDVYIEIDMVQHQLLLDRGLSAWFALILVRSSTKRKRQTPTICGKDFYARDAWGVRRGDIYFRKGDTTVRVSSASELEQLLDDLEDRNQQMELASSQSIPSPFAIEDGLYHLLAPDYEAFIGREQQQAEVIQAIEQDPRIWIINLHGPGGVGKTALATWAVYQYYRNRRDVFEAILFLSAKDRELTTSGIGRMSPSLFSLENLLENLLLLFSHEEFCTRSLEEQKEVAVELLCAYRTLLVLDNMEAISDGRIVNFIQTFPPNVLAKVLMTSRTRSQSWEHPLQIKELSLEEVDKFVSKRSREMNLDDEIRTQRAIHMIRQTTGGLPLAIEWTLGQYAATSDLQGVLSIATASDSPLLEFSFRNSWNHLNDNARQAMAILSIFDEPPTRQLWRIVLDWSFEKLEDAIDALQSMTFIYQTTDNKVGEIRYRALPITLTFSRNMLNEMGDLERICWQRYQKHKEQVQLVATRIDQYEDLFDMFSVKSENERRAIVYCQMAERQETLGSEEAEHYYKEAIDTEPRSIYVNVKYGRFLVSLGRIGEGVKLLKMAVSRSSKTTGFFANYNLALAYDQVRSRGECVQALREALKYRSDHVVARHMLGTMLSRLGEFEEAIAIFDALITEELKRETGPTNTFIYASRTKAISLLKSKRRAEAKDVLTKSIKIARETAALSDFSYQLENVWLDYNLE